MKLVFFDDFRLGVLKDGLVVDVSAAVRDIPHTGPHDLINGVKKEELLELITHLAFYSGWPTAMSAANVAKKVFEGGDKK